MSVSPIMKIEIPGLENPFTTEYLEKEIQFYNPKPYAKDGLVLKLKPIRGVARIDEYLNKAVWGKGPDIPVLTFGGQIWMSLTWQEVQSQWVPFNEFGGDVLVGGLGMGYAALRFAVNPDVESVTVYETDPRVIEFFQAAQAGRPELDKIRVIQEDIHKAQGSFDFAFIDTYPTLLDDEMLRDARFFCQQGHRGLSIMETPHFWGQELVWFTLMRNRKSFDSWPLELSFVEIEFFKFWQQTGNIDMPRDIGDVSFCVKFAEAVGRL